MVYKGFVLSLTAGDCDMLLLLLDELERNGRYRVDRHMAGVYRLKIERFLEVTPDGSTSTHGPADA